MSLREMPVPRKLWEHPNPDSTNMAEFMRTANRKRGLSLKVKTSPFAYD